MSIKWMIKKSDFYGIKKSINKESDSKKLEQLKKEVIAILEKKESQEYKKAIEYFENSENHYTHLEKSITGEWIEKAGYGVGTVRIWKGKKYKKVSASPTRWVRVFDKNDRGAATSMGRYIAQVKKCQSVEELYQFCMKQRSLFQDENGVDLPIMDKLKAAIDEQGGKIERGEINTNNSADKNYIKNSEKYDDDKAYEEYQKLLMKENPTDADNTRIGELVKEHYKHSKKEWIGGKGLKELNEAKDDSKVLSNGKTVKEVREQYGIKVDKKETDIEDELYKIRQEGEKLAKKENLTKEDEDKLLDLSKKQQELLKQQKELVDAKRKESKDTVTDSQTNERVLSNYMGDKKGVGDRIKEGNKETIFGNDYSKKHRLEFKMNVMGSILGKPQMDQALFDELSQYSMGSDSNKLAPKYGLRGEEFLALVNKVKDNRVTIVEPEESESEKHQNRSDAMKGNKNAYKGKAEEIANKRILSKEDMLNKPLTTIQKYANADVYNMDKFKTINEALEDSFNTYKGSIDLGEVTKDELAERVGKEWAKKQNHDVAREIFKDYNAGKLTVNDDGILENNDEPVNNSPFGKTKISKAIEKYASDKQIKSTVNKISVEDFSSTDESRAAMNGVFHENGYNIATDGRMLSMIKADYPSEDEGKIKANKKYSKVFDKKIKQAREVLQENEKYLAEAEKQGKKLDPKFVNDKMRAAKAELENAEKTKESGVIDDKFPNYKKVIPSVAGNDVEPAKGFEDFNKILKIAKVAAAYKKNTKSSGVSVKVGDYNFNPDMLLNAVAMAEKHGLKNVNFRPNSYNPAQSPVEFSGDNGYVVIMPTLEDTYVFDADTGDVSSKYATEYTKDEELEKFLSGASTKENVKKALFDLIDMLDESEDEETDFEDNDATQPDLFNSTAYKVSAALDSVFNYR